MPRVTITISDRQREEILEIGRSSLDGEGKSGVNFSEACRDVFNAGIASVKRERDHVTVPPLFLVDMIPEDRDGRIKLLADGSMMIDHCSAHGEQPIILQSSMDRFPFLQVVQLVYEHVSGRGRPEINHLRCGGGVDILPYDGVHDLRAWSGIEEPAHTLAAEYNKIPSLKARIIVPAPNRIRASVNVKDPPGEKDTDLIFHLRLLCTFPGMLPVR